MEKIIKIGLVLFKFIANPIKLKNYHFIHGVEYKSDDGQLT